MAGSCRVAGPAGRGTKPGTGAELRAEAAADPSPGPHWDGGGLCGCIIGGCAARLRGPPGGTPGAFGVRMTFNGRDRRHVAVVMTTDGRRVQVPVEDAGLIDVSLLGLIRSLLLGLDGLLGLITGSRRENRGTRRD